MYMYLIVEVVAVACHKDVDISHNFQHIQTLVCVNTGRI